MIQCPEIPYLLDEAEFVGRLPVYVWRLVDSYKPGASDVVPEAERGGAECDLLSPRHDQLGEAQVEANHQVFPPSIEIA